MSRWCSIVWFATVVAGFATPLFADEPLYRYEGDVLPTDPSAGWLAANACDGACVESLENGHFVTTYETGGDHHYFDRVISRAPAAPPPTLWVEWGFRSTQRMPRTDYTCDAFFTVTFRRVSEDIYMLGDAVVSASGDFFVPDLAINEFHTYRFESTNGVNYRFSVDGLVFVERTDNSNLPSPYLQFGAEAGCNLASLPKVNEWDFIRYGTIRYGEKIVASDPPQGFVDVRTHAPLDRFTVTYDQPNYVYIDEITVLSEPRAQARGHAPTPDVTGLAPGAQIEFAIPAVIATRRLDNGSPDVVEIVLDRRIPYNATTRFTFNDGVAVNTVEYTFAPGDTDGDGDADLADLAAFQNCFGGSPVAGPCQVFDADNNGSVAPSDFPALGAALTGP